MYHLIISHIPVTTKVRLFKKLIIAYDIIILMDIHLEFNHLMSGRVPRKSVCSLLGKQDAYLE